MWRSMCCRPAVHGLEEEPSARNPVGFLWLQAKVPDLLAFVTINMPAYRISWQRTKQTLFMQDWIHNEWNIARKILKDQAWV